MSPELTQKLYENYPKLYKNHVCGGFSCEDGWFDIINILSEELEDLLNNDSTNNNFVASQIKEKFGGLRFYIAGKCSMKAYSLISKAEFESYKTCEYSGKSGRPYYINKWVKTICKEEVEKKQLEGIIVEEADPLRGA